jgi:CheY-like chemotaxis protein
VQIRIEDNGVGMEPAVVSRIFDPFFTTKPMGQGSGMGLAVVYGVAKQHAGFVTVHSEPGHGSVFHIYLPASRKAPTIIPVQTPTIKAPPGSGLILLAEDDPAVQIVTAKILRRHGYEVLIARDGQEALDLLPSNIQTLRLAVLDAIMPKHSGKVVYDRIKELRPDLPVLFCSGYSQESLPLAMAPGSQVRLLTKPYTAEDLINTIQQMLRQPN